MAHHGPTNSQDGPPGSQVRGRAFIAMVAIHINKVHGAPTKVHHGSGSWRPGGFRGLTRTRSSLDKVEWKPNKKAKTVGNGGNSKAQALITEQDKKLVRQDLTPEGQQAASSAQHHEPSGSHDFLIRTVLTHSSALKQTKASKLARFAPKLSKKAHRENRPQYRPQRLSSSVWEPAKRYP